MRILHILDHSLPAHSGYTFRTQSILHHQRQLGWQTFHITSPKHPGAVVKREDVEGWEYYRTLKVPHLGSRAPVLSETALMYALRQRILEVVDRVEPDVIHAHSPVLNALPALSVGKKRRIPVVYEVRALWEDAAVSHGTCRPNSLRYTLSRAIETFAVRRSDAVVTICERLRGELIARGVDSNRLFVVPNGVDLAAFTATTRPSKHDDAPNGGPLAIGFIGSFYQYEGLHFLVEALFPEGADERGRDTLILVGGGPEEPRLKEYVKKRGLCHRVRFVGRIPHSCVADCYAQLDVLIYPRLSMRVTELVTPLKPLEAMAMGKIIVASDVGGHRELIRDGETGYLFRAEDAEDLRQTLERVREERGGWPSIANAARWFVETERSWHTIVPLYDAVYQAARQKPDGKHGADVTIRRDNKT